MADLTTLLERVEKADGAPDWELDRDIGLAIGGWELKIVPGYENYGPMLHAHDGIYVNAEGAPSPSFIESIDEAVALVEKQGFKWWTVGRGMVTTFHAELRQYSGGAEYQAFHGQAPIPTLALLVALLRALIAKDTETK